MGEVASLAFSTSHQSFLQDAMIHVLIKSKLIYLKKHDYTLRQSNKVGKSCYKTLQSNVFVLKKTKPKTGRLQKLLKPQNRFEQTPVAFKTPKTRQLPGAKLLSGQAFKIAMTLATGRKKRGGKWGESSAGWCSIFVSTPFGKDYPS